MGDGDGGGFFVQVPHWPAWLGLPPQVPNCLVTQMPGGEPTQTSLSSYFTWSSELRIPCYIFSKILCYLYCEGTPKHSTCLSTCRPPQCLVFAWWGITGRNGAGGQVPWPFCTIPFAIGPSSLDPTLHTFRNQVSHRRHRLHPRGVAWRRVIVCVYVRLCMLVVCAWN